MAGSMWKTVRLRYGYAKMLMTDCRGQNSFLKNKKINLDSGIILGYILNSKLRYDEVLQGFPEHFFALQDSCGLVHFVLDTLEVTEGAE